MLAEFNQEIATVVNIITVYELRKTSFKKGLLKTNVMVRNLLEEHHQLQG